MIKPWRCEDGPLWACLLTGHDEPSPGSHDFIVGPKVAPGALFSGINRLRSMCDDICTSVYTDVFAVDTFCNRPVLFKNTFLWTYLDLKRILPKQLHLTVWSCLHRQVFRQTTVTLGHRQKLMATGGSLSWIWIASGWTWKPTVFFLNTVYMKPIYNMLKNSKVPDVQWQYIKAKLAYIQGRDLGRFVFKHSWNCVSLHLRLVDSDVECSRTALNSFTRRARTMLAPMDSESLTVPLALEGSGERSSSQHRERERERICVAKLRSRPTDGAQTDAAWYTLLAGLGKVWLSERLMKLWVFPVQEPFCRFFTDFQPHLLDLIGQRCRLKYPTVLKDESCRATPSYIMLTSFDRCAARRMVNGS